MLLIVLAYSSKAQTLDRILFIAKDAIPNIIRPIISASIRKNAAWTIYGLTIAKKSFVGLICSEPLPSILNDLAGALLLPVLPL